MKLIEFPPDSYVQRVRRGVASAGVGRVVMAFGVSFFAILGLAGSALAITDANGDRWYLVPIALVAMMAAANGLRLPKSRSLRVPRIRTVVRIVVGDLWDVPGNKIVAVNEYFDGELGRRVERTSLHGQTVARLFQEDASAFERAVDISLAERGIQGESTPGHHRPRFRIGTVAAITESADSFVLATALSRVDLQTLKATASVADLWECLMGAWEAARTYSNGKTVVVPLIGSGLSDVPLSTREILHFTLLSIAYASRFQRITSNITITLRRETFGEVDLSHCSFT